MFKQDTGWPDLVSRQLVLQAASQTKKKKKKSSNPKQKTAMAQKQTVQFFYSQPLPMNKRVRKGCNVLNQTPEGDKVTRSSGSENKNLN